MKELEKLKEAILAKRFDGRIDAIRKAFRAYKKSLEKPLTWLERTKTWLS